MYESSVITGISQHKGQPNLDIPQSWGGGGGVRPSFFDHSKTLYNYKRKVFFLRIGDMVLLQNGESLKYPKKYFFKR